MPGIPEIKKDYNLLKAGAVKVVVHSRFFPGAVQTILLLIYLLLIYMGWNEGSESHQYTHITSFFIWVIWWPFLILLALFASRLWCTVCPLRLVTRMAGKLTLGLKVPRWFSENRLAVVTGLFFLHTIIVFYGINHTPRLTSIYLLMLLGYAVIIVAFRKKRILQPFLPLERFYRSLFPDEHYRTAYC
jgi:hypothetical protein